jgi:hypothetical protein
MNDFEFTDRYKALGIPYPDPETMCKGQCEGTGYVPVSENDMEEPFHTLWLEAEAKGRTEDGYHFVVCPDCKGNGKERGMSDFMQDEAKDYALNSRSTRGSDELG